MDLSKKIDSIHEYTEEQWDKEMSNAKPIRISSLSGYCFGSNLPCPLCCEVGFYSPRFTDGERPRKYRACKYCGFWQEAEGEAKDRLGPKAYRCVFVRCPEDGEIYDWFMPGDPFRNCRHCNGQYIEAVWPVSEPNPLYLRVKDEIRLILLNAD